ncbi:Bug family tripartite tricarboxylate transporter substrate binding protein [Plastoroseomonas hellenica]|uniref:Bug family tripartite tricarboxylate transporter substrate binding protein n=1 Tax=Plastoroseomonas hellenica TaxID=2687306 RepID=UPI001BA8BBE8|nr:tripartite tricarboxylate transporter substrate-binding protein [Plastoroseomonas hellenica]MBR0645550.1 tripartite tricarboxylate transporter substrate binding protein [Plastoroseomonas hellenica]
MSRNGAPRPRALLMPRRRALLAGLGMLSAMPALGSTSWPDRLVRLVIPFGAGGPIDSIGRLLAELLRERLGQPFIIDNRAGAGGSIGLRNVVQSPPDGSAFVLTSSSLASIHALQPSQGLDPREMVAPVSLVADVPTALVVHAASDIGSVQDLVAAAKARPGRLTYGTSGVGSSNHLSGALFGNVAGVEITHVPYRGASPAMTALLAREVDMVFASTVETLPHVQGGRARILGVATEHRVPGLAAVPAIHEIVPGYVALNWYAIAGPRALPSALIGKFAMALGSLRALPEVQARFAAAGTEPLLTGPEVLAARLAEEVPKWQRVVAEAGIRVE